MASEVDKYRMYAAPPRNYYSATYFSQGGVEAVPIFQHFLVKVEGQDEPEVWKDALHH